MAYSISLTKRTNGGYTIVTEDYTCYPSVLTYHGIDGGVILFSRGLNLLRFYRPSEWTIQSATGYTTVVQVCDALDALGISATEGTDDIEALLTTIDADTGSILTAVQLMDDDLDDARLALQVMDDWDESDRAKVNLIASQAGIDGNSGAVTAKTPRVTLASDDPAVVSLGNIDNAVDGSYLNVNINAAGTDVATNSGTLNDQTLRVAIATDDVNAVKIVNATELIDDTVATLGTTTYAEATTKGLVIGAVRTDAESSLANTTNEITPLSISAAGRLKVESQGRITAPAILVAAASAQNVTTSWVDLGNEITTGGANMLALWVVVTHTNSVNVRVRILGKHTASTGAEFLIPIKTVATTDVKVNAHYYELDTDATQNILLDWDVTAVPYVKVQIQCETVGATADTVSSDYTLMY